MTYYCFLLLFLLTSFCWVAPCRCLNAVNNYSTTVARKAAVEDRRQTVLILFPPASQEDVEIAETSTENSASESSESIGGQSVEIRTRMNARPSWDYIFVIVIGVGVGIGLLIALGVCWIYCNLCAVCPCP